VPTLLGIFGIITGKKTLLYFFHDWNRYNRALFYLKLPLSFGVSFYHIVGLGV